MKGLSGRKHRYFAKPICCSKCGSSSHTLVKVDDHYECQNKKQCEARQRIVKIEVPKEI